MVKRKLKDRIYDEEFGNLDLVIEYGLESSIRQDEPYFVIGCSAKDHKGRAVVAIDEFEMVLKAHPDMKDLVDMYNSDINGVPLYALDNGWHYVSEPRLRKPLCDQDRTDLVSGYLRIPYDVADDIIGKAGRGEYTKKDFAKFIEEQKPRWKEEANAILEKYNLLERERPATLKRKPLGRTANPLAPDMGHGL